MSRASPKSLSMIGLVAAIAIPGVASAQIPFDPTLIMNAAEKVTPAVVNVTSKRARSESDSSSEGDGPDSSPPIPSIAPQRRGSSFESGYGSGVLISADGLIVTNSHVIDDEDDIAVTFADARKLTAKLIGRDRPSDLAVIKVQAGALPFLKFGDSSRLRLGEIVLAVGNPFGMGQTATMGIVSAKSRATRTIDYEDFIQTDASINPGNAGGALVNMRGELIGINTDVMALQRPGQGIGFAVPSNMVKPIVDQLLENGRVRRGWIGVSIQDLSPEIVRDMKLADSRGVLVKEVLETGPARRAGIASGDVITRVGETPTASTPQLRNLVALLKPGSTVKFSLIRDRKKMNVTVILDEKPADGTGDDGGPTRSQKKDVERGLRAGLSLVELGPELRARLGVPSSLGGAVVEDIDSGTAAGRSGLRPGDVITSAAKQPVRSIADFDRLVRNDAKVILLKVHRGGRNTFVMLVAR